MNFIATLVRLMLCMALFFYAEAQTTTKVYKEDCSKFWLCGDHGTCTLRDCGPGTEYNPIVQTCDYPYNPRHDCKRH